jgi:hypothetical protein
MQTRKLGGSGLEVSAVGLGRMAMSFGYGPAKEREGQGQALRSVRGRRADHPSRAPRPAGDGAPERVLALVAGAGGGDPAAARGAGHRVRAFQPAGQGLPDRQDRGDDHIRQHGLPQHRPSVLGREPPGQPGPGGPRGRCGQAEGLDAGAGRAGLGARAEAVDRAHSRHDEAGASRGEPGRGRDRVDGGRSARDRRCGVVDRGAGGEVFRGLAAHD